MLQDTKTYKNTIDGSMEIQIYNYSLKIFKLISFYVIYINIDNYLIC